MLSWKVQISWKIIPTVILKENGIGTGISDLTKEEQENLLKKYAGKSY